MRSFIVALLIVSSSTAHADDAVTTALKTRLAEQVKALNAGDAKAFAATFRDDGYVILPGATLEGHGPAAIETATKQWIAFGGGKGMVTVDKPQFGKGTMGGWYFANLVVKAGTVTKTFRATAVLGAGAPLAKAKAADYAVIALHVSEAIEDKAVTALIGKLPKLANFKTEDDDEAPAEYLPEQLGKTAWDGAYGVMVGSAPKEVVSGKAVAATLKAWKGLKIQTTQAIRLRDSDDNGIYSMDIIVAHIEISYPVAGKIVRVPFRGLIAFNLGLVGNDKPHLLVAHFSIATR